MKALNEHLKLKSSVGSGVIPAQAGIPLVNQNFGFFSIRLATVGRPKLIPTIMRFILLFSLWQMISGCMSIGYYEGSYHGKVFDSKTLEPIQGAVVLGVWHKGYPGAGGVVYEYYDARETITDKNGEFTMKGMGPRVMTYLEKVDLVIFKAGYEDIGASWESLKKSMYYRDRVKWQGNKAIIPMDKWSMEQRRKRFDASFTGVPKEKQKMLLEEIKKEKIEIR